MPVLSSAHLSRAADHQRAGIPEHIAAAIEEFTFISGVDFPTFLKFTLFGALIEIIRIGFISLNLSNLIHIIKSMMPAAPGKETLRSDRGLSGFFGIQALTDLS
ncbi:hypothetical protein A3197_19210 [Candidatus Thiodiazotropha endoloripes]|nr:hypothetical protein A3197_19210 [Candidatus Thiodiazotropha endoloripes]